MGCASSKKKTVSIEDLSTDPNAPKKPKAGEPTVAPNKNGDAGREAVVKREVPQTRSEPPQTDATKPIQIPGQHKSFLAPDGIPFIDEDVDSDAETTGRRDVNKNVPKEPVVIEPPRPDVAKPAAPPAVPAAAVPVRDEKTMKHEEAIEVLRQEVNFAQPAATTSVTVTETVTTVESHTHQAEPSLEEQQRAAVKIQAGIRGYRDRQKVKAIRATKTHNGPADVDDVHVTTHAEEHHAVADGEHPDQEQKAAVKIQASFRGFKARQQVKSMKEHDSGSDEPVRSAECNEHTTSNCSESDAVHPDEHDPAQELAATKIQASYKGYKTRKQLGKIKK